MRFSASQFERKRKREKERKRGRRLCSEIERGEEEKKSRPQARNSPFLSLSRALLLPLLPRTPVSPLSLFKCFLFLVLQQLCAFFFKFE